MTPAKANANETESGKTTKTKGKWKTNDCNWMYAFPSGSLSITVLPKRNLASCKWARVLFTQSIWEKVSTYFPHWQCCGFTAHLIMEVKSTFQKWAWSHPRTSRTHLYSVNQQRTNLLGGNDLRNFRFVTPSPRNYQRKAVETQAQIAYYNGSNTHVLAKKDSCLKSSKKEKTIHSIVA